MLFADKILLAITGGKMRFIKLLILIIFITGLFQMNISAKISSRIEGIVSDKDTGQPIEGVSVILYCSDNGLNHFFDWETKTDESGYFRFEIEDIAGTFYVQCNKAGYVPFLPDYYRKNIKPEYIEEVFRLFNLKEGQIKHLKIELERGGTLTGKFYVKDSSGTYVLTNSGVFLNRLRDVDDTHLRDTKIFEILYNDVHNNGEMIINGLEPSDNYYMKIISDGYYSQTIEDISIVKNEANNISFTLDCIGKASVKGFLTINGEMVYSGSVNIANPEKDKFGRYNFCAYPLKNEKFFTLNAIPPGKYRLSGGGVIKGNIMKDKELYIELKAGETKTYNFIL
jgi:hypothetical protein